MFDKGDIAEPWVKVIGKMNRRNGAAWVADIGELYPEVKSALAESEGHLP